MTLSEWLKSTNPTEMVDFVLSCRFQYHDHAFRRLCRLVAAAACRSVFHMLNPDQQACAHIAELDADGLADHSELVRGWDLWFGQDDEISRLASPLAANAVEAMEWSVSSLITDHVFCSIVRDIFDPWPAAGPGLPSNPDILRLATSIYDNRDFAGTPILADALEEAGCTDSFVLRHLRGFSPCPVCLGTLHYLHPCASQSLQPCYNCLSPTDWPTGFIAKPPCVLGCYVIDTILGKY